MTLGVARARREDAARRVVAGYVNDCRRFGRARLPDDEELDAMSDLGGVEPRGIRVREKGERDER